MTLGWSQDRPVKVQLKPDLQAKVDEWAARTGRQPGELIEEAIAGYFDELGQLRTMLDTRYDELKAGRAQPIEGTEARGRLREKSKARRANGSA